MATSYEYRVLLQLLGILALLSCVHGTTVFYAYSVNESECPAGSDSRHCQTLSGYATSINFTSNQKIVKLVLLPGQHVLDTTFYIDNITSLSIQSMLGDLNTSLIFKQGGILFVSNTDSVEIYSLTFESEATNIDDNVPYAFQFSGVSNATITGCNFTRNAARLFVVINSTFAFEGNLVTYNNRQWISLQNSTGTISDNLFANNTITGTTPLDTSGIYIQSSTVMTTGSNSFSGNAALYSGAMDGFDYTVMLDGNTTFERNTGLLAGCFTGANVRVHFAGKSNFENNFGEYGGVFACLVGLYVFNGEARFVNNSASYGGVFYIVSATITFFNERNVTFFRNTAISGGAIFLAGRSRVSIGERASGYVNFVENFASRRGGAIFIQDTNTLSYCFSVPNLSLYIQQCYFEVPDYSTVATNQKKMYFIRNYASEAGSALYGGVVDTCIVELGRHSTILVGKEIFEGVTSFASNDNTDSSVISSEPFTVCTCDDGDTDCANTFLYYTVFPGAFIEVRVTALGQRNGTVPATIVSFTTNLTTEELEITQAIRKGCSDLSYTIYAEPGMGALELYAEGSCLTQGIGLTLEIQVLPCPPGFVLAEDPFACVCDSSLIRYTNSCNTQDGTILRDDKFWVGYDNQSQGIISHPFCPFDYCVSKTITFRVEDSDAQCNHDRSGLLCGECSEGLSLLLGSDSCENCSDNYLSLLLFFAVAGVILVAFLLLLNLTVAIGTINGLIFYANIVSANSVLVFPSNSNAYLDILKVFIAWINLDFGIKSCFYDGMDAYAKTWLQYVFPVYIWALIGLVFLVSHFSDKAARILGSNPVSVLATLILLSYAKVVRTVIETFSSATLDNTHGDSRVVWLFDANVPYIDASDGRHLGLFLFSLLMLVVLFIPYTLILFTSQWLQIKSHWKVLSWLNKPQLRAFLDAYHAPYKPRHRYWTGLLLLVRFALLVTTARTLTTNPSVIFMVTQFFAISIPVWAWIHGGVYRKWYLNVIEGFFFLNLGLLSASLHHIGFMLEAEELTSSESEDSRTAVSSTLLTASLFAFFAIVVFHGYLQLKRTTPLKKVITSYKGTIPSSETEPAVELKEPITNTGDRVTMTTYVTLREPLLDDC